MYEVFEGLNGDYWLRNSATGSQVKLRVKRGNLYTPNGTMVAQIGFVEPVSTTLATVSIVTKVAETLKKFLGNFGFTNDNGVIAARDKIASYVTQVLGNKTEAYNQLYTGYKLAHDDINNVGTKAYYVGVLDRLNKAALTYIVNHAQESSKIFGVEVRPQDVLDRYSEAVQGGMKLDHAFWTAFTGKKDPYDIRTGSALPPKETTNTNLVQQVVDGYTVVKDAQGQITQIRDAAGKLLSPGTAEYNRVVDITPEPQQAGMGLLAGGLAILILGGMAMGGGGRKKKSRG